MSLLESMLKPSLLIPKKRHKKKKIKPRRQESFINKKIEYYIKKFSNIIYGRIIKAQKKFTCLQCNDAKEEIAAQFMFRLTRAIQQRQIQLWKVNDKIMNTYIQRMMHTIILDEIRKRSRHKEKHVSITLLDPEVDTLELLADSSEKALVLKRFDSGFEMLVAKEILDRIIYELEIYNPSGKELLLRILNGDGYINYSSPSVCNLRAEIASIVKEINREGNK